MNAVHSVVHGLGMLFAQTLGDWKQAGTLFAASGSQTPDGPRSGSAQGIPPEWRDLVIARKRYRVRISN